MALHFSAMLRFALAWLAALAPLAHARADALPSPAQRYELNATLEPALHRVHGRVRIAFTNTSARPLEALLFHLYLNAFASEDSVFLREASGALRGHALEGEGRIELGSLTVNDVDVLATSERELVADDHTQLRAPLERPLAPGESVRIESTFEATLPPVLARSGYAGDFFAVAQWFPKLAKLEPDGTFAGSPYHALGEFYADFADYTLTLTTPRDTEVIASGTLRATTHQAQQSVRRFEARAVHDVAFVAARGYTLTSERAGDVELRVLAPPGYQQSVAEQLRVVRAGLAHYGRLFGAYPYPSLSMALPPRDAEGAAGMEYPTLFFGLSGWRALGSLPSLTGAFVTAHELAHQWFQGLVASDELRWPVLDEGLAQWAALDLLRALYGPSEGLLGFMFERFEVQRLLTLRPAPSIAAGLPAPAYGRAEYAASVYGRAALALESIRRAHGRARFEAALGRYARTQRFRHPTPRELEQAFDEVYGAGFGASVLRPLLLEGEVASVQLSDVRRQRGDGRYVTRVRARHTGRVTLPTALAAYDEDGRVCARVAWPSGRTLETTLETRVPIARLVLDPDRALLLDANVQDQVANYADAPPTSRVASALGLAQLFFSWLGP